MYKKLILVLALALPPQSSMFANTSITTKDSLIASEFDAIKLDSIKSYKIPSVVVTSSKAEAGITPISYSEINHKEIQQKYISDDMPKILSKMPSVIYTSKNGNPVGNSSLSMRGFDQRRITVLINGIPQNDPEDHQVFWIDLPDLAGSSENIQVQRGAALNNCAAPSIGGLINITTVNYANQQGVKIFSGLGVQEFTTNQYTKYKLNTNNLSIEASSGLINNWAFYTKLARIKSDGYRDDSHANLQSYFLSTSHFSENLSTQINIFGGPIREGLAYNGVPKSYIKNDSLRKKNLASLTKSSLNLGCSNHI